MASASDSLRKRLPLLNLQSLSPASSFGESGVGSTSTSRPPVPSPWRSKSASSDEISASDPPSSETITAAFPGVMLPADGANSLSSSANQPLQGEPLTEPARRNKQLGHSPLRYCLDLAQSSGRSLLQADVECRDRKHSHPSNFIQDPLSKMSPDIPVVTFASPTAHPPPDTDSSFSISTVSSSLSSPHAPATPTFNTPDPIHVTTDAHRLISAVLDFPAFQSLLSTAPGRASFREWLANEPELHRHGLSKLDRWVDEVRADALVKTVRDYSMALYSLYHSERAGSETTSVVPKEVNDSALSTMSRLATLDGALGKSSTYLLRSLYANEFQDFIHTQLIQETRISLQHEPGSTDSFCVSNPRLEDNPVVMVSSGFVELTGYQPEDIIGRNCRILQQANPRPLPYLREAIATGKSACELVLNYKKDGTPFYCLINIVPLFDSQGELMFYIGGQVKITGSVCGQAEVFEPRIATLPTLAFQRELESSFQPGDLPTESPRMRAHEDQLFHYSRFKSPKFPLQSRMGGNSITSSLNLNRSDTDMISEGGSTEPSSRSFVGQLKVALRKNSSALNFAAAAGQATGMDMGSDGSAIAALGSNPGPFMERVSTFSSTSSQVLIFERQSFKVVYINRDCLPCFGLPNENEEDILSPAVLHHNFLDIIYGENGKKTKEVRSLVHNAVSSGLPVSCHCFLKWDIGVKLNNSLTNSPRQTFSKLVQKNNYQSSYSCLIHLIPLWASNRKCVVYIALVM